MRRALAGVVLAGLAWTTAAVVGAAPAAAHPLGNFTTNTYAGLVVRPDAVTVDYVVDLAEVPTLQARGTGPPTCAALAQELDVTVDGRAVPLLVAGSDLSFPPGEGGLDTLRLECRLEADVAVGSAAVRLRDGNLTGRVGWHEVTAVGDGATLLESDVPAQTVSDRLTDYPSQAPLDQREASLTVRPGGARLTEGADGGGAAAPDRGGDRLTDAFTSLVGDRSVTPGFGLLAALLAVALGCLHALAPGHGKTLMAAYVLGEESRLRQLAGLGLTVAGTHTAGVLVLGLVVSASNAVAPEAVLTGTSVASGVLLAAVGAGLLVRRLRRGHHGHAHPHGHGHDHDHDHDHAPLPRAGSWRVVGMGFAGGLVPSPSALVVLLGAAAVGRVWFGVVLVVAYGLGMAAALVAAGALLVRARPRLDVWSRRRGRLGAAVRALPLVTAGGLLVGGLSLAARALGRV
ncbi:MAG: High-affinity nickel-transporter [Acidimicrobiales bacterium]|nr:High-affinity nickel-transporter [Acidimicrobiales bacterium]